MTLMLLARRLKARQLHAKSIIRLHTTTKDSVYIYIYIYIIARDGDTSDEDTDLEAGERSRTKCGRKKCPTVVAYRELSAYWDCLMTSLTRGHRRPAGRSRRDVSTT